MSNKLEDYGKSLELAGIIDAMKPILFCMDLEYAKEMAGKFIDQGNFQDSAAVLNPSYDPDKSNLLRVQGKALKTLVEYVELLKRCEEMKQTVAKNAAALLDIMKMFL